MQKTGNIEKLKLLRHAKYMHNSNDTHLSNCKPSVKVKNEMKHMCSLFSNNKKKNSVLIGNAHSNTDNNNQTLLKQCSIVVAQGENPISNAVVDDDVNKSNNKHIFHLLPHAKSTMIAFYCREGTKNANNKDCKIKRTTLQWRH